MTEQPNLAGQKHILVVDDNVDLALTYQEVFELYGYKVSIATSGVLALNLMVSIELDAILCDVSMPQLSGDAFFQTVERTRPHLARRFIFITGNDTDPTFEGFIENIRVPVLYKPVSIEILVSSIRKLLAQEP